jgi:uncharacterized protein YbjT (DUF2867 family)
MKRLVIVGASGMVGRCALRYALHNPNVQRVMSVGRRNLGILHSKLTEVLHLDFADCSALAETLSGQDAAVFCLGTYTGAVSDVERPRRHQQAVRTPDGKEAPPHSWCSGAEGDEAENSFSIDPKEGCVGVSAPLATGVWRRTRRGFGRVREASRSRASDSPVPGEHTDV